MLKCRVKALSVVMRNDDLIAFLSGSVDHSQAYPFGFTACFRATMTPFRDARLKAAQEAFVKALREWEAAADGASSEVVQTSASILRYEVCSSRQLQQFGEHVDLNEDEEPCVSVCVFAPLS
jgi:hypothetical protein